MSELEKPAHEHNYEVKDNPLNPAPPEILREITGVEVIYMNNHDGGETTGFIEVHESLADDVRKFFARALEIGFPIDKVETASNPKYYHEDERLMQYNVTSGFNYRTIAGTNKPSMHALGRAIDVNPKLNPYTKYDSDGNVIETKPEGAVYDPDRNAGTLTADHELVILMKELGWEWGGDWTPESGRVDLHHFQKPA